MSEKMGENGEDAAIERCCGRQLTCRRINTSRNIRKVQRNTLKFAAMFLAYICRTSRNSKAIDKQKMCVGVRSTI